MDKNKQPIEDIRKVKREDLDWLSMLDLDADILSDPPSRPISKDNLLTTDWINKLVPQSDELPNLPELDQRTTSATDSGSAEESMTEAELDQLDEEENLQQTSSKRSEVFDLLLRDDLDLSELRASANFNSEEESAPHAMSAESHPAGAADIDLIDEFEDKSLEEEAADSLDSWLSDIAADYVESAEQAADQAEAEEMEQAGYPEPSQYAEAAEVDEVLDSIPDWLSWEDQDESESPSKLVESMPEVDKPHFIEQIEQIEQNEALGSRTLPSETVAPDVMTSIEELLESTQSHPAVSASEANNLAHTKESLMPTSQNNSNESETSDEKLQAWLADLENRTAEKYGSDDESWVNKADQGDRPSPYQLDTIPEWIKESNDPFANAQEGVADDDDDLEWIIGPDELSEASGVSDILKPEDEIDLASARSNQPEPITIQKQPNENTPPQPADAGETPADQPQDELPIAEVMPDPDNEEEEEDEFISLVESSPEADHEINELKDDLFATFEEEHLLSAQGEAPPISGESALAQNQDDMPDLDPIDSLNELWAGQSTENMPDLFPLTSNPSDEETVLNIDDMFFGEDGAEQPLGELLEHANELVEETPPSELEEEEFDPFRTPEGPLPVPTQEDILDSISVDTPIPAAEAEIEEAEIENEAEALPSINDLLESMPGNDEFDPFNTPVVPQSGDYDFERVDPLNAIGTSETEDLFSPLASEEIPTDTLSEEDIEESIEDLMAFLDDSEGPQATESPAELMSDSFESKELEDDEEVEALDFFDDEYTRPSAPINLDAFKPQLSPESIPETVAAESEELPLDLDAFELSALEETQPEEGGTVAEADSFPN
ncbi:MAG: hypothetical protein AAF633_00150, partial [Chloroflexota bacterium]